MIDFLSGFFGGAYSALKAGSQSIDTTQAIINSGSNQLNLPPIVPIVFSTIILVMVLFILISAITKREM